MATRMLLKADTDFCVGCRMCEIVCSLKNAGTVNPYQAKIRVSFSKEGVPGPVICRHCAVAKCQQACKCPGAIYNDANGVLIIDQAKCNRCLDCVKACPFKAIQVAPDGSVLKCDLCGGEPECVRNCPPRPENSLPNLPYPRQSCLKYVERKK
jgi:anaerobic carbon-monoxide dehydrogenase iron sulfur subunit